MLMLCRITATACFSFCFFFNDPAPTEIYTYWHTLSLHDALPIWADDCREFTHSIHTQIGNCCRSALIFVRLELPVACPIGKIPDFGSYRRKALAVCATHDRREQSAFDRNRNADIRAGEAEYPVDRKSTRLNSSH